MKGAGNEFMLLVGTSLSPDYEAPAKKHCAMTRAVGQSFAKYQMNRQLEMAARQIELEPDVRLAEIAATLGFCDEFHLSKAFKRKYGAPPSQYRRRNDQ